LLAGAVQSGAETLAAEAAFVEGFAPWQKAEGWLPQWRERLAREPEDADPAALMRSLNPAVIPRNHRIEEAITAAVEGDLGPFERLLAAIEKPYEDLPEFASYTPAPKSEERVMRTFCGT
jgi:uncharacterized protein YdiU (UPF0061 family)